MFVRTRKRESGKVTILIVANVREGGKVYNRYVVPTKSGQDAIKICGGMNKTRLVVPFRLTTEG